MTNQMTLKWLRWIKNMMIPGSDADKALDNAIDSLMMDETYKIMHEDPHEIFFRKDYQKARQEIEELRAWGDAMGNVYIDRDKVLRALDKFEKAKEAADDSRHNY